MMGEQAGVGQKRHGEATRAAFCYFVSTNLKYSFVLPLNWMEQLMSLQSLFSTHSVYSTVAGVAGNAFAFVLFVSPISTFRRILRNKSTEQFSGLPYIYAFLNCLICLWYGTPFVSRGMILVFTVNSIGAVFQFIYISIFISYAKREARLKTAGLLVAVFGAFAVIVCVSMKLLGSQQRRTFVGCLTVASLISMFASPLSVMNLVIRTRSVEFMPFYLSLSTLLMSLSFFAYGMLKYDIFIYVPNGVGTILGASQLALYCYYHRMRREGNREPLTLT